MPSLKSQLRHAAPSHNAADVWQHMLSRAGRKAHTFPAPCFSKRVPVHRRHHRPQDHKPQNPVESTVSGVPSTAVRQVGRALEEATPPPHKGHAELEHNGLQGHVWAVELAKAACQAQLPEDTSTFAVSWETSLA